MNDYLDKIKVERSNQLYRDISKFINQQKANSQYFVTKKIIDLIKIIFNKNIFVFLGLCFIFGLLLFVSEKKLLANFSIFVLIVGILSFFEVIISIFIVIILILRINNQKNNKYPSNINELMKLDKVTKFSVYLAKKYNLFELKFKEEDLKQDIENHESLGNISIIPLSFFLMWFLLFYAEYTLKIQTKNIIDNFPIYFQGISLTLLFTTTMSFLFKLTLLNSIKFKKQALSAVIKAQILITEA